MAAFSTSKAAFRCSCERAKHARFLGVQCAARSSDAFNCRVCAGKGSRPERLLYSLLDNEHLIELYAVETHSVSSTAPLVLADGTTLRVSDHRWDAMTLLPPNLLIEVQGQQHTSKLDTRPRSPDASLANRLQRDEALVAAARAAGFSVLWLHTREGESESTCIARWAGRLQQAVRHVAARGPPLLFSA
jgi:hypothetical protein